MFSRGIEKERRRGTVNEVQLLALNFEHVFVCKLDIKM